MASQAVVKVEIGGEVLDVFKVPPKDSALVKEQVDQIEKDINFDLISAQSNALALALRVSYLGVARFPLLQIEVNKLAINVTLLYDQCIRVLTKFQRASMIINRSYIAACKYLMTMEETFALLEFKDILEKSKEMEVAVSALSSAFDDSSNIAQGVYDTVEEKIDFRNRTTKDMEIVNDELAELDSKIDKTSKDLDDAQKKEDEAAVNMRSNNAHKVVKFLGIIIYEEDYQTNTDGLNTDLKNRHEDKMRIQEELKQCRIDYQKKLLEKLEKTAILEPFKASKIQIENSTLSALDCCLKGLKHTRATLISVKEFWQRISDVHGDFDPDKMEEYIALIKMQDRTERSKLYNNDIFRVKIKLQEAAWVAIAIASNTCLESINTSSREMHVYIGEHYAPDEAMVKLQEIMGPFMQRTKAIIDALDEKNLPAPVEDGGKQQSDGKNLPAPVEDGGKQQSDGKNLQPQLKMAVSSNQMG